VLELKIFIGKLVPVDGFPAGTIVIGEIPSLAHKARDHTVEGGTREPESLFPSAESTKVLGGLGDNVAAFQKAPPKMRARVLVSHFIQWIPVCTTVTEYWTATILPTKLHGNAASRTSADGNVEENFGKRPGHAATREPS
jgi:hypothetical protein